MKEFHILSLGAGVQSTTLALLRNFDVAVFADTQEESQAVYRHLEWLRERLSYPVIVCSVGKLGDDLKNGRNSTGGRYVTIPAFTTDGVKVGQTRRQCTKEYKTELIAKTICRQICGLDPHRRIPADVEVHQYIGISRDEARRSINVKRNVESRRGWFVHFPLLDMGWTRVDCLRWLAHRVPHPVPRSACVFCPFKTDREWLRLKREDAAGWSRAVEIDEALRTQGNVVNRGMRQTMYLHRSCKALVDVELNEKQYSLGFNAECEGMCGV